MSDTSSKQVSEQEVVDTLALARQHHKSGRWPQAEALYRQVLAQRPDHAQTLNFLGALLNDRGRSDEALALLRRATEVDPTQARYHFNLAVVLARLGWLADAEVEYRQALAIVPQYPQAWNNLGTVLVNLGRVDEAIGVFGNALALRSRYIQAQTNLGNALKDAGRLEESIAAHQQVLAWDPEVADAWYNLAISLRAAGKLDEAISAYRRAIERRPNFANAYNNLGDALYAGGQLDEAIAAQRKATEIKPDYAEAHYNVGTLLQAKGELDQAVAAYRKALELRPDYSSACNNLATVLGNLGHLDETIALYDRALAARPNHAAAHSNRIYTMLFHPGYDEAAIAAELARFDRQHGEPLRQSIMPHGNDRGAGRRLRIGYVSPDFRDHVLGRNLLPLLREHDHDGFEVFCYSNVQRPDYFTQQCRAYANAWRDITGIDDEAAAKLIREDGIDILVDLTLHTARNRLLIMARKPAPVQATFGGYPGSTGLATVDYRLTDGYLEMRDGGDVQPTADPYVEKAICLQSFWCYDPQAMETASGPQVNPLPAASIGHVTFGCLNGFRKINGRTIDLWAPVLAATPGSRLILMSSGYADRQAVIDRLGQAGVGPERVEFLDPQPRGQYLQTYHRIDVALDALPYNGHTTSLDALWMGVPVITRVGQTIVGRGSLSQLNNLDLPELVARSDEEFARIAIALGNDLPRLAKLRASLRQRMLDSVLTDGQHFAQGIEAAYRAMWQQFCAGEQA
jgi:predicted O-linked N-acetylglucosamine transferase (SPINDLY family)